MHREVRCGTAGLPRRDAGLKFVVEMEHGRTPSPRWGEGGGEGLRIYRRSTTPHPDRFAIRPLPQGEAKRRGLKFVVEMEHGWTPSPRWGEGGGEGLRLYRRSTT